ncbi:MAG: hypothetical protein GY873_39200 [Bosea sp.]|uniref:hypothetical protein n=1 Tax=Bosea sp. (in: a-proteobacteria) TaxID=1871050 RepID=UPI0023A302A8|nr:hypothetical protein [Bosea sp. (in: a-proteobacteria)]MCP4740232.1 hypothetical protein [Bosea sp. (in: a-proteobacteria)]
MLMRGRQFQEEVVVDPAEIETMLRASLKEWEIRPSGDGRVSEETAALLIGYSPLYTRNLRQAGYGPSSVKLRGKVWYRIPDIARWLAANIEPF